MEGSYNMVVSFLAILGWCLLSCAFSAAETKDMSLYCDDIAKMTNLCNEIFTNLACAKTCTQLNVQKKCGIRRFEKSRGRRDIDGGRKRVRRIIGGRESDHGAWPWHVSLYFQGKMKCAGSVLSKNWILTAANCFDKDTTSNNPSDWTISAGDFSLQHTEKSEQIRNVEKIIKHGNNFKFWKINYKNVPDDYDIALLKLDIPLNFDAYISPVCLPETDQPVEHFLRGNRQCRIVGWGNRQPTPLHDKLNEATVKLVPRDICNLPISYNGTIHQRAICAGYGTAVADACDYDSGGALACKENGEWVVVGLVSWGYKCGKPTDYGVYTNVPELRNWVIETLLGYNDGIGHTESIHERVKNKTASYPQVPASERKTYLERNEH